MAQPPAVVVQAYEPVGHLRLYRLGEQAQFYCVHCCKDKTDSIVATTHDNWAKTICKACYDSLARRQEPSLAKIAATERQPAQAKQICSSIRVINSAQSTLCSQIFICHNLHF